MDRTFKSIDLTTSVALLATVFGIVLCLFLLFAPATFGKNPPEPVVNTSVDFQVSLRWIQPLLGQAIVEDTLIKQQYRHSIGDLAATPEHRTLAKHPTQEKLFEAAFTAHIDSLETDHSTRVQWVMGRLIVTFTSPRNRTGTAKADDSAREANQRVIALAQETGAKLDDMFKADRRARLGTRIGTETPAQARLTADSWGRVGPIF
jgi:hypothetical protein